MSINKRFMEKFGKVYSEEQLNEKQEGNWKPYPLNEQICEFIKDFNNK